MKIEELIKLCGKNRKLINAIKKVQKESLENKIEICISDSRNRKWDIEEGEPFEFALRHDDYFDEFDEVTDDGWRLTLLHPAFSNLLDFAWNWDNIRLADGNFVIATTGPEDLPYDGYVGFHILSQKNMINGIVDMWGIASFKEMRKIFGIKPIKRIKSKIHA